MLLALAILIVFSDFATVRVATAQIDAVRDRFQVVEDNRCHDCEGKYKFRQLIFWRSGICHDYRIVKRDRQLHACREGGEYVLRWLDDSTWREVRCEVFFRSRTRRDPEMDNRLIFPLGDRVRLSGSEEGVIR